MTHPSVLLFVLWSSVLGSVAVGQDRDERTEEAVRLNKLGIQHLEAGRFREAIDAFLEARDKLPDSANIKKNLATAFSHLGVDHLKSGRYADAARALGQASGLDPENSHIDYYRGVLAFKRGDYRESIRRLEACLKKKPDNRAAWETLGHGYYRLDRLKETIAAWEKVLSLEPSGHSALKRYLKRVRAELGFKEITVAGRSRHFRVKADQSRFGVEAVAGEVLRYLEDGYDKVCADLGFYPAEVVTVVLYTNEDFQRVTGTHHWVGGTFDGARIRLKVRDFHAHRDAIRRTLIHELTHMVVHRLAGGARVPAWINEGFARVEEGVSAKEADGTLARMGGKQALFALEKLEPPFTRLKSVTDARRAYAQSCSFAHYLVISHSTRGVGRFIKGLRDSPRGGVSAAFKKAFGIELDEAFKRWKATLPD
jgi:tetratricopeptide (TPR) repeat protein